MIGVIMRGSRLFELILDKPIKVYKLSDSLKDRIQLEGFLSKKPSEPTCSPGSEYLSDLIAEFPEEIEELYVKILIRYPILKYLSYEGLLKQAVKFELISKEDVDLEKTYITGMHYKELSISKKYYDYLDEDTLLEYIKNRFREGFYIYDEVMYPEDPLGYLQMHYSYYTRKNDNN